MALFDRVHDAGRLITFMDYRIANLLQEIDALKSGGGPEAVAAAKERATELEKEFKKTQLFEQGRQVAPATRRRGSRAWPFHLQGGDRLQPRPPCKGAAGYGQAPCKGRSPAGAAARKGQPPAGVATARGHDRLRTARKGLPNAVRPQGVILSGQPQGLAAHDAPARRSPPAARPWPTLSHAQG
ncbi:hypothetical protein BHE74_00052626 [Ensete ventricosum]|nr:hypothetical protein BHE74_00052626 [Ensete ventricosum]